MSKSIPTRKVTVNDPSQLPHDYSSTPGGSIFSTTPGGTRIVYERSFLLQCRNSPLAMSPPANLPQIPGITCEGDANDDLSELKEIKELKPCENKPNAAKPNCTTPKGPQCEQQFEMDI